MEQCAGLLCVVRGPLIQSIPGQRSHLDVAVYIILLDCAFVVLSLAALLSWCRLVSLSEAGLG